MADYPQLQAAPAMGLAGSPSICWDGVTPAFAIVYASAGMATSDPIYARSLLFDDRALVVPYGLGCAGTMSTSATPYSGSSFFEVRLNGGRPNAATVLVAGAASADLPLPNSLPGCRLFIDPAFALVTLNQGLSSQSGLATHFLAIPSSTHGVGLCGSTCSWIKVCCGARTRSTRSSTERTARGVVDASDPAFAGDGERGTRATR